MNEYDPYQNQSRNYYQERRGYTADDLGYPQDTRNVLKNPVVAVLILLVTVGVFIGVISLSLSGDNSQESLPVVRADQAAFKDTPSERGGMEIPNSESTVFAQIRGDNADEGAVEDLFAADGSAVREDVLAMLESVEGSVEAVAGQAAADAQQAVDTAKEVVESAMPPETALEKPAQEPPKELHPAGSSPETLAFVRSVLEEKKAEAVAPTAAATTATTAATAQTEAAKVEAVAEKVAKAEPASGAATAAAMTSAAAAGTHFVQLASITDQSRTATEWNKLKAQYSALSNAGYRVDRTEIAGKGVFYRIQAGPFSKQEADAKCNAIKSASGSCFIVAK